MHNHAHNASYTTCYHATSSCCKPDMSTNGSSSIESSIRSLPAHPHQPTTYQFPKREFGKKTLVKRSFQPSWYTKWPWLHYMEDQDAVLCFICAKASLEKKIHWSSNADSAFISTGFSNWKDATVKFANHASSVTRKLSLKLSHSPLNVEI